MSAAQVVSDVFAKANGFDAVAGQEARADEAAAKGLEDLRWPRMVSVASVPKLGEEPLQISQCGRNR